MRVSTIRLKICVLVSCLSMIAHLHAQPILCMEAAVLHKRILEKERLCKQQLCEQKKQALKLACAQATRKEQRVLALRVLGKKYAVLCVKL